MKWTLGRKKRKRKAKQDSRRQNGRREDAELREGDKQEGEFTPGLMLAPGYRSLVTIVRKGCWTGPTTGPMQSNQDALPPDYAVVRGCATDFCNTQLKNHDTLPNLSQGVPGGGVDGAEASLGRPGGAGRTGRDWRGAGCVGEMGMGLERSEVGLERSGRG